MNTLEDLRTLILTCKDNDVSVPVANILYEVIEDLIEYKKFMESENGDLRYTLNYLQNELGL